MKKQFSDPKERLRHIFEKQVYGLAPTEIIYHIALSYILGFNEDTKDIKHNFRQLDALPYAKEGTLQQKLDELFDWLRDTITVIKAVGILLGYRRFFA